MTGHRPDPLWTAEEVALYLGVPIGTLYQWRYRRAGPRAYRVGRYLRYDPNDVRSWLATQTDDTGASTTRPFHHQVEADAGAATVGPRVVEESGVDQAGHLAGFRDYGERWRLSRQVAWAIETRKRVESNLRNHLYPVFGDRQLATITQTDVLEWVTLLLTNDLAKSTVKLYFELLAAVLSAAVIDRVIPTNPCGGVRLAAILRGLTRTPKWVPSETEVLALLDAVPQRYRAAIWLGAGEGYRLGEALGIENTSRCIDAGREMLHVVQQLRYSPREHGGFYLSPPKAGSTGTVDLDPVVAEALAEHVRRFPPVETALVDITSGVPVRRTARLLFTTTRGNPFTDRTWSREWAHWRDAAGWPKQHGTFHALRHFFATTLIANHAEPQQVQHQLRHKTLRITLEIYVHWRPKQQRRPGIIGAALRRRSLPDQHRVASMEMVYGGPVVGVS
jgi:integrase